MIYVCTGCEAVYYQSRDRCPDCGSVDVPVYTDYLSPANIQIRVSGSKGEVFKSLQVMSYTELVHCTSQAHIMSSSSSHMSHVLSYSLGLKEYEMVDNFKEEELPLHINDEWYTDIGREAFKYRLDGSGSVCYPDKDYYADRYLKSQERREI